MATPAASPTGPALFAARLACPPRVLLLQLPAVAPDVCPRAGVGAQSLLPVAGASTATTGLASVVRPPQSAGVVPPEGGVDGVRIRLGQV